MCGTAIFSWFLRSVLNTAPRLTSEWERKRSKLARCGRERKTGTYLIGKSTQAAAVGVKIDLKVLSHVINACCVRRHLPTLMKFFFFALASPPA